MPDQLSREEFEAVAREVMQAAPKGLSSEQFRAYILDNVRAKQYEGQENAGSNYLGDMLGGAVDRVKEFGQGIADNVQLGLDRMSGKAPMPTAGEAIRNFASGVKSAVIDTPAAVASAINTDDPREAGARSIDAAMMIPAVLTGKRFVTDPATTAAATAVKGKGAMIAARTADTAFGSLSVTHPWQGAVRGATGQGPVSRFLRSREKAAGAPPPLITDELGINDPAAVMAREATVVSGPQRSVVDLGRTRGGGPIAQPTPEPPRATIAGYDPLMPNIPNPNAGAAANMDAAFNVLGADATTAARVSRNMPNTPASTTATAPAMEMPQVPGVVERYMPNTPSGSAASRSSTPRLGAYNVPDAMPSTAQFEAALSRDLSQRLDKLVPSHEVPPTPARVADPGTANRPATTSRIERQEATQRQYQQGEAANAYEQGGRVNRQATAETAEFIGYQDSPDGPAFPLFNIKGGPLDGSTVSAETLTARGITVPELKAARQRPPQPGPNPNRRAAEQPATTPTPASPADTPASKSKGATKMSGNDMEVFSKAVQSGMNVTDAMAEVLKQRASRHAEKYGAAKTAAADRKSATQTLFDLMKQGSH